jgi:serine/threonine protein kinase
VTQDSNRGVSDGPERFGRYEIKEQLATGGMAKIYKASTSGNRVFTLKKILPDYSTNEEFIRMFLEEAKISLSLKHPNIVRVLDFGQLEGSYYLAMEYVFGKDLGSLLRTSVEKRIYVPIDVACYIIWQCCRGLNYAHTLSNTFGEKLGVVHRDISPPNIMLSYNGEAKILDFGIAKAMRAATGGNTRSGVLKGKFCYMSPEQAMGQNLNPQSDVFSLAIVLHELLTSKSLFYSKDEIQTLENVRKAKVPAPSQLRKGIPKELDRILQKALQKKTSKRYRSCEEFGEDLKKFLEAFAPRTDSRNVARFFRQLFAEDFSNRIKKAREERWRDVLVSGGADDEIMLDRNSKSSSDFQNTRSITEERNLFWWQKALYDPRSGQRIRRIAALVVLGFGLSAFGFYSYWDANSWVRVAYAKVKDYSNPDTSSPSIDLMEETGPLPEERVAERGTLAYWIQLADKADEAEQYDEAQNALARALRLSPFDLELQARFHFSAIRAGKIEEACEWFRTQEEVAESHRFFAAGLCFEMEKDWNRAYREYLEFLRRFPSDARRTVVERKLLDIQRVVER